METSEGYVYLVEGERDGESRVSKGVVWLFAFAVGLVVDVGLVAGAVHLAKSMWA